MLKAQEAAHGINLNDLSDAASDMCAEVEDQAMEKHGRLVMAAIQATDRAFAQFAQDCK